MMHACRAQELAERIHVLESELENQGRGVNVLSEQHASQLADVNAAHDAGSAGSALPSPASASAMLAPN
eukprot:2946855-Rhodomonas_salina.3